MIINLGCASVDNHIPRDDIFDYHPIRECNIYIIFYVVILRHVYGERKGSLPGHKLVKPGHYLENSLICMIFQSALLTVWFAAHFILCHGMISAQT